MRALLKIDEKLHDSFFIQLTALKSNHYVPRKDLSDVITFLKELAKAQLDLKFAVDITNAIFDGKTETSKTLKDILWKLKTTHSQYWTCFVEQWRKN